MCKYCCTDSKIINGKSQNIFGEIFLIGAYINSENSLNVEVGNTVVLSKKINYCPMCGRKMGKE